jgi:hypothetical protein
VAAIPCAFSSGLWWPSDSYSLHNSLDTFSFGGECGELGSENVSLLEISYLQVVS